MMKKIDKRTCRKYADRKFSINKNNGLLYISSIKYLIRTSVENISGKRILILYLCAVDSYADGKISPKYVVFQGKDDFITLEYAENGKIRWRQSRTYALGENYHSILDNCAFYNRNDELITIRFCDNKKDTGIYALRDLQLHISGVREQRRKREKEAKIRTRMKTVSPLPKKTLQAWFEKEVFPAHIFYDYHHGRKLQSGYCTHCHSEVQVLSPRHNKETVCPVCGLQATAHATGRNARVYDRDTVLYLQKHGNELLVRVCKASVSYNDPHKPSVAVWENARFFISADGKRMNTEPYYYSYTAEKLTPWVKGTRPCRNRWAYYFEADTCGHIYTKNLEEVLKGTPWQYCQLKDFYLSDKKVMGITPYLREYLRHPSIEYLVKLKLFNLTISVVYSDRSYLNASLNLDGKNIKEVLGVGKQHLAIMQELDIGRRLFGTMKGLLENSIPFDIGFLKWCKENEIYDVADLVRCLKYTSTTKLVRYLETQSKTHTPSSTYSSISNAFNGYEDYIRFCEELEYDLSDDFLLFPRHLKDAHDRASEMVNKKKVEGYNKKIAEQYESLVKQYQMTKYGFTIMPPKTASDIVDEGHALHHCVGGYVSRVANEECVILFLRDAKKPDTPFYTIEVKNGEVAQIRGDDNCDPTPPVQQYMDYWKQRVLHPAIEMQQAA